MPGDLHRDLRARWDRLGESLTLVLLPVWVLSLDIAGQPSRLLINGQTGSVAGPTLPISSVKLGLAMGTLALLTAAMTWLAVGAI